MILVDANILIYAHVSSFAQHPIARDWLDQQLNGSGPVGLPWASMIAFLRLVTNPRVFEHPEPIGDAWRQVDAWLACETAWIPQPTEGTPNCWAYFSRCRARTAVSSRTLIWLRLLWNMAYYQSVMALANCYCPNVCFASRLMGPERKDDLCVSTVRIVCGPTGHLQGWARARSTAVVANGICRTSGLLFRVGTESTVADAADGADGVFGK